MMMKNKKRQKKKNEEIAVHRMDLFIVSFVSQVKSTARHVRQRTIMISERMRFAPFDKSIKSTLSTISPSRAYRSKI